MAEEVLGKIIDREYRLLSELGHGAMGVVYRAEQLDVEGRSQRQVALKTLLPPLSTDPDFSRRFLREVRVAMQLRSLHNVTVYDSGKDEAGQLYYTMELIRGQTLREVLQQQGKLSVERAVRIASQICEALAEAHGLPEPVVHRDLKPPNIFIEQRQGQEWVKIGDFGIAKVLGEHTIGLTQTGMSPGTPRYMAPEQWTGQALDGRTDLYALGIILYEMLTGRPPFTADGGPLALMSQHVHTPPPALPVTIPADLRALVERLLAKTPQERPPDALSVRRALEAACSWEGTQGTLILGEGASAFSAEAKVLNKKASGQSAGGEQKDWVGETSRQSEAVKPQKEQEETALLRGSEGRRQWWSWRPRLRLKVAISLSVTFAAILSFAYLLHDKYTPVLHEFGGRGVPAVAYGWWNLIVPLLAVVGLFVLSRVRLNTVPTEPESTVAPVAEAVQPSTPYARLLLRGSLDSLPREIAFLHDDILIGSGPECDVILRHPSIARQHARMQWRKQGYVLCDLQSPTGTYVNGRRITENLLKNSWTVQFGEVEFVFFDRST